MSAIEIGMSYEKSELVTHQNSAKKFGSGALEVYATPAMIALMEGAAMLAIEKCLSSEQGSVGTKVDIEHIASTPLGMKVTAVAKVIAIDGKKVTFAMVASDERSIIGQGSHERFIIDNEKFLHKTNAK